MTNGPETRARIDSETVRGLQLINGGMAAGLVTLLPTILRDSNYSNLGTAMIVAAMLGSAGLVCSVVHNRLRRKCSLEYSKKRAKRQLPYTTGWLAKWQTVPGEPAICTRSVMWMWASLVFFLLGAASVGTGFFLTGRVSATALAARSAPAAEGQASVASAAQTVVAPAASAAPGTDRWLIGIGAAQLLVFTLQLVVFRNQAQALRKSVDAATRATDIAVAAKLPIFIVESALIPKHPSNLSIRLGNHGRTPAIVTADCMVLRITPALDLKPRYPVNSISDVVQPRIIDVRTSYDISRPSEFSADDWDKILKRDVVLWAYGYIEYVDFLKFPRRDGFCLAFEPATNALYPTSMPGDGRWIRGGPAAYTYSEVVDPAEAAD